jgi:hypothetical protein
MRRVFRDETAQREFERLGYVKTPLLSPAELAQIRERIEGLRPDDEFAPRPSESRRTYHCTFLDSNRAYRRETFELLREVFEPHVDRLLADFELLQCNFYVKPPHEGFFEAHQNWPMLADPSDTSVSLWCPVVDVTPANGTIGLVPGSHKILPEHVMGPGGDSYFTPFKDRIFDHLEMIALRAGEALFFDDSIVHGSDRNRSDEPRIAIQLICVPAGETSVYLLDRGGKSFDVVRAPPDFWLETDINELFARQKGWTILGSLPNRNRQIDEAEFVALLAQGDAIRAGLGEPGRKAGRGGIGGQVKRLADRLARGLSLRS